MIPLRTSGKPVTAITPRTWNNIATAINSDLIGQKSTPQHPLTGVGTQWIWIKNTGTDRAQFEASGLDRSVDSVLSTAPDGNRVPVLTAIDDDDAELPTVIWQEPVAANAIGRACITGLSLALVAASEEENLWTLARSGNTLALDSGGTVALQMKPNAEEATLLLVDLSGGPGGATYQFFRIEEAVTTATLVSAKRCLWDGSGVTGDVMEVRNWSGLLDGAPVGYVFLGGIEATSKEWVFVQGGCIGGGSGGGGGGSSWSAWNEF